MSQRLDLSKLDAKPTVSQALSVDGLFLPKKFDLLLAQARSLLTTISFLHRRKCVTSFPKLRDSVEMDTKHSFTQQTLAKVLAILPPNIIHPEWRKDNRKNMPWILHIDVIGIIDIAKCLETCHCSLLTIVKRAHSDYCEKKGVRIPVQMKVWEASFNPEEVPDVVPISISAPPQDNTQQDFIKSLNPMANLTEESISAVVKSDQTPIEVPKQYQNIKSYAAITKIIQKKQEILKMAATQAKGEKKNYLFELADLINIRFVQESKRPILYNKLCEYAKQSDTFKLMKNGDIENMVSEIINGSDGFFSLMKLTDGTFVKVDKVRSFQTVRASIARIGSIEPIESA